MWETQVKAFYKGIKIGHYMIYASSKQVNIILGWSQGYRDKQDQNIQLQQKSTLLPVRANHAMANGWKMGTRRKIAFEWGKNVR